MDKTIALLFNSQAEQIRLLTVVNVCQSEPIAALQQRIDQLLAQVARFTRQYFGRKSEKLAHVDSNQLSIFENQIDEHQRLEGNGSVSKLNIKIIFSILILTILSISTYGQSSELSDKEFSKLFPTKKVVTPYHNNWTQKHYPKRIHEFKREPLEFGEIVFIGNSITEGGLDWSRKFGNKHIRNRGIAGDVTDGVLKRLNEITYFKPKAVLILIGINDLFSLHHEEDNPALKYDKVVQSPEYIGNNILKIAKIIHRKSPVTKIYVRTLLPTRRDYLKDDILILNKMIKKNEAKGYYEVIDFYTQFVDAKGELIEQLTNDGVHLNDDGYKKWISIEKPLIEELLKEQNSVTINNAQQTIK